MPVTVLAGERDERYRALGRRMAALLPAREPLQALPGGTALALENPRAVAVRSADRGARHAHRIVTRVAAPPRARASAARRSPRCAGSGSSSPRTSRASPGRTGAPGRARPAPPPRAAPRPRPAGRRGSRRRTTSAPEARTSVAAASSARDAAAARDLQADRVRHARAERAVLGRGLVDRDPRATRSRTSRIACEAVGRLLDQLQPRGRERLDRPHRLLDRPGAVGVQAQGRLGPAAARTAATRAGVVAQPNLQLDAVKPRRRPRARACSAAPSRSVARDRRVHRDAARRLVGEQLGDRPAGAACPRDPTAPCRSPRAPAGSSSTRAARFDQPHRRRRSVRAREHRPIALQRVARPAPG